MRSRRKAQIIAVLGASVIFLASLIVLRRPSMIPLGVGGFAYVALLLAFWPKRPAPQSPSLPKGVSREDFQLAISRLTEGARRLRGFIAEAPAADEPLLARMAELMEQIREHHRANPEHVRLTRTFVRHTLSQIIGTITDYIALSRRAGPDQADRLAEISRGLEGYVPALERVEKACLDNDLTALEISVEVLNDQIDRKR